MNCVLSYILRAKLSTVLYILFMNFCYPAKLRAGKQKIQHFENLLEMLVSIDLFLAITSAPLLCLPSNFVCHGKILDLGEMGKGGKKHLARCREIEKNFVNEFCLNSKMYFSEWKWGAFISGIVLGTFFAS